VGEFSLPGHQLILGTIPSHWNKYKTPRGTAVGLFIVDLKARLAQLESIAAEPTSRRGVWLGGLFQPEAYITATRQAIAHQKGWSLEQLVLSLEVEESSGEESFVVQSGFSRSRPRSSCSLSGLKLSGASWNEGRLVLNDGQSVSLKASQLSWTKRDAVKARRGTVNLPVYLNGDRSEVLFAVDLETNGVEQDEVAQRGVCLTAV